MAGGAHSIVVVAVYMSGLPGVGAGDPAECHRDHAAGYVPQGKSGPGQDGAREGRDCKEVPSRRASLSAGVGGRRRE